MTLDELQSQVKAVNQKLLKMYGQAPDDPMLKYYNLAKLQEEVGELAEQVLKSDQIQRKAKGDFKENDLHEEWLDVLVTILVMGTMMGIDFPALLPGKLEKALERLK